MVWNNNRNPTPAIEQPLSSTCVRRIELDGLDALYGLLSCWRDWSGFLHLQYREEAWPGEAFSSAFGSTTRRHFVCYYSPAVTIILTQLLSGRGGLLGGLGVNAGESVTVLPRGGTLPPPTWSNRGPIERDVEQKDRLDPRFALMRRKSSLAICSVDISASCLVTRDDCTGAALNGDHSSIEKGTHSLGG
jgi:hypothetical protein